jgi:hypothetical protein
MTAERDSRRRKVRARQRLARSPSADWDRSAAAKHSLDEDDTFVFQLVAPLQRSKRECEPAPDLSCARLESMGHASAEVEKRAGATPRRAAPSYGADRLP